MSIIGVVFVLLFIGAIVFFLMYCRKKDAKADRFDEMILNEKDPEQRYRLEMARDRAILDSCKNKPIKKRARQNISLNTQCESAGPVGSVERQKCKNTVLEKMRNLKLFTTGLGLASMLAPKPF